MNEIQRLDSISELHGHIQEGVPCVYRPVPKKSYPFQRIWTIDWMMQMIGSKRIKKRFFPTNKYIDSSDGFLHIVRAICVERMTSAQFVKEVDREENDHFGYRYRSLSQWEGKAVFRDLWKHAQEIVASIKIEQH